MNRREFIGDMVRAVTCGLVVLLVVWSWVWPR